MLNPTLCKPAQVQQSQPINVEVTSQQPRIETRLFPEQDGLKKAKKSWKQYNWRIVDDSFDSSILVS